MSGTRSVLACLAAGCQLLDSTRSDLGTFPVLSLFWIKIRGSLFCRICFQVKFTSNRIRFHNFQLCQVMSVLLSYASCTVVCSLVQFDAVPNCESCLATIYYTKKLVYSSTSTHLL